MRPQLKLHLVGKKQNKKTKSVGAYQNTINKIKKPIVKISLGWHSNIILLHIKETIWKSSEVTQSLFPEYIPTTLFTYR